LVKKKPCRERKGNTDGDAKKEDKIWGLPFERKGILVDEGKKIKKMGKKKKGKMRLKSKQRRRKNRLARKKRRRIKDKACNHLIGEIAA